MLFRYRITSGSLLRFGAISHNRGICREIPLVSCQKSQKKKLYWCCISNPVGKIQHSVGGNVFSRKFLPGHEKVSQEKRAVAVEMSAEDTLISHVTGNRIARRMLQKQLLPLPWKRSAESREQSDTVPCSLSPSRPLTQPTHDSKAHPAAHHLSQRKKPQPQMSPP